MEILLIAKNWISLECIMLSEISLKGKIVYYQLHVESKN